MRRILILFLGITGFVLGQTKSLTPSYYYTFGKYSDGIQSVSNSGFLKFNLNYNDYLIGAYDNIKITSYYWNYKQQMYLAGGFKNFYPFYFKLNYAYISGRFIPKDDSSDAYTSKTNLINSELIYNYNLFFLGAGYTYLNMTGTDKPMQGGQAGIYFGWQLSTKLFLSIRPVYSFLNDGRKLYSAKAILSWSPSKKLTFSFGAMIGKRAYFFDPDYFVIYNQDETQTSWYEARAELNLSKRLSVVGFYQRTEFSSSPTLVYDYTVSYAGVGVKYAIIF